MPPWDTAASASRQARPRRRACAAFALLWLLAPPPPRASAYPTGIVDMGCVDTPGHGTDLGLSTSITVSLLSLVGTPVSSYTPSVTYTLQLAVPAGTHFRGFVMGAFLGPYTPGFGGAMAGSLAAGVASQLMGPTCPGGITHVDGSDKVVASGQWTAPPSGSGSVTLFAEVVITMASVNWHTQTTIAELVPTPSNSPSGSPSFSPSGSPASATPTPSGTHSVTPTLSPVSKTPTVSGSNSATPTPSGTVSITPTSTPVSNSPTPSVSLSATPSLSLGASPSNSATVSLTRSLTPSQTPSPTGSLSPSPTVSQTPSPTISASPLPTASLTPSPTVTVSLSLSSSSTRSLTPSLSAASSQLPSPSASPGSLAAALAARPLTYTVQLSDALALSWSVDAASSSLLLRLYNSAGGWAAIAFNGASQNMIGGDAIIVQPGYAAALGQPTASQYVLGSYSFSGVVQASASSLLTAAANVSGGGPGFAFLKASTGTGGAWVATFARPLAAGAYSGAQSVPASGGTVLLAAWGTQTFLAQHSSSASISGTIDLARGTFVSGSVTAALRKTHGSLMFIAWGILAPCAVLLARFGKELSLPGGGWLVAHRRINTCAWLLSLVAFAIILSSVPAGYHFATTHGVVGLVTVLLGLLMPLSGLLGGGPLHVLPGYAQLLLAFSAIFLGLAVLGAPASFTAAYAVILCAFVALFATLEARRIREKRLKDALKGVPEPASLSASSETALSSPLPHMTLRRSASSGNVTAAVAPVPAAAAAPGARAPRAVFLPQKRAHR